MALRKDFLPACSLFTCATEDNLFPSLSASGFNKNGKGNGSAEMVLRWNMAAIDVVNKTQEAVPGSPIPPEIISNDLTTNIKTRGPGTATKNK